MRIRVGERMPDGVLRTRTREGVEVLTTDRIFGGRRVVLFAVPGAFTGTCSEIHLPGFLARVEDFAACGIDRLACLAVNDAEVMEAWRLQTGAAHHILMLSDGNADYVRALGLEVDLSAFGMGTRSRRFAAVVEDGVVQVLEIESGADVTVSSAESILQILAAS